MHRYQILVEYDGSKFIGWQIQSKGQSIQKSIQVILSKLLKEKVVLTGAGRTDSGVHAIEQSAHFVLKNKIIDLKLHNKENQNSKLIKIPICIDEEFSLDIKRLTKELKMKYDQIYNSFFDKEYYCYMTGFIAGMPFLGDTRENIRLNRLETPRVKVPKGSIGITEQFCNIYTYESPGGWNIIGNTPVKIFDKSNQENPALINPGDRVTFYKISKQEYQKYNE